MAANELGKNVVGEMNERHFNGYLEEYNES